MLLYLKLFLLISQTWSFSTPYWYRPICFARYKKSFGSQLTIMRKRFHPTRIRANKHKDSGIITKLNEIDLSEKEDDNPTTINVIEGQTDEEIQKQNEQILDDVTDAEALLACWSYLQKHKRIGNWTDHERRRAEKVSSRSLFLTEQDYEYVNSPEQEEYVGDNEYYNDVPSSDSQTSVYIGKYGDLPDDLENIGSLTTNSNNGAINPDNDSLLYGAFTSFPSTPPESRIRRSRAIKKLWTDPDFRERWYQRRWGNRRSTEEKERIVRHRKAERLARELPSNFLGSKELADMTEDEIAYAIKSRVAATTQRVAKRKKTLQKRKEYLRSSFAEIVEADGREETKSLTQQNKKQKQQQQQQRKPRDLLFTRSQADLEEQQRKRSERAKKLYATRLQNQKDKNAKAVSSSSSNLDSQEGTIPPPERRFYPPKQLTPRDAVLRIENSLDRKEIPAVVDVRLILKPKKLRNRKPLLRRILHDSFDLRGKCIPVVPNKNIDRPNIEVGTSEQELEFVTHSSIEQIGSFLLHLLEKEEITKGEAAKDTKTS